jgi:lipoyl(octanoyl) transferase
MTAFRWLPYARAEGATNMAADDVLLHAAAKGVASLRFYGWTAPTLSLGYFQPTALRCQYSQIAPLPWVRRSSGGKALLHHHELTYALALPAGFAADWMARMHQRVILPALNRLGLAGRIEVVTKPPTPAHEFLCFEHQTLGDLVCAGHKIVGSAQRKKNHCLLQHGAILLAQSEFAPTLPGIKEITGMELSVQSLIDVMVDQFCRITGWRGEERGWSAEELGAIEVIAAKQYRRPEWNEKR